MVGLIRDERARVRAHVNAVIVSRALFAFIEYLSRAKHPTVII